MGLEILASVDDELRRRLATRVEAGVLGAREAARLEDAVADRFPGRSPARRDAHRFPGPAIPKPSDFQVPGVPPDRPFRAPRGRPPSAAG